MKRIDLRRVFIIAGLTALVITYVLLWLRMMGSRAERTGADFIGFYTAARIAQNEGPGQIYIPEVQQKIEQELVGFDLVLGQVLLFNHLPYFIPLLGLVVNGNYVASFIRWTAILLFLAVLDTSVLIAMFRKPGFDHGLLMVLAAGTLTFYPMFTSLMNGQDTVFLLLGAALWLTGCLSGKDIVAGLGLALMTIRPQLALILALPFLFRRRVFYWFLTCVTVLGIYVLFYLGLDGTRALLHILAISASGEWYGLHPEAMPTLTGLLHRMFPDASGVAVQTAGLAGYLLAMVALCLLWIKCEQIGPLQIGLAVIAAIFFIPYLHYHDLTLLLIPAYCLIWITSPSKRRWAVIMPLAISFCLLLGFFWESTTYLMVYLVMAGLAYSLWRPAWLTGIDRSDAQS